MGFLNERGVWGLGGGDGDTEVELAEVDFAAAVVIEEAEELLVVVVAEGAGSHCSRRTPM